MYSGRVLRQPLRGSVTCDHLRTALFTSYDNYLKIIVASEMLCESQIKYAFVSDKEIWSQICDRRVKLRDLSFTAA